MNELLLTMSAEGQLAATRVLRRCPRVELGARRAIGAPDLPRAKLVVVERGVILLTADRAGSVRPIVIAVMGSGAVFAPPRRNEQLVGLTDALVRIVPPREYGLLLALPQVADVLVERLLEALRERQENLANATGGVHSDRLREKLFQLARSHGKVSPDGVEIELPLTHELLAQMVGSARETVTCSLARLQREGLLVRTGRGYRLNVLANSLETAVT